MSTLVWQTCDFILCMYLTPVVLNMHNLLLTFISPSIKLLKAIGIRLHLLINIDYYNICLHYKLKCWYSGIKVLYAESTNFINTMWVCVCVCIKFVTQSRENGWRDRNDIWNRDRLWYGITHRLLCIPREHRWSRGQKLVLNKK